ncbi:DUF3040 domain-containing protein [Nonomuraea guangzhouensis]|uniref:DUF3040 domain-containing protein n=1 Tax=Nonomuraea guangzhouensis TaxID=1291555 RepID=A0ABW4GRN7_9ACTN|nr:DUF3040 domain-containing protein [Nonomuraea guangzhouensis]
MLDDYEREALREIQRRLLVEDPEFAQSFDADTQRLNRAATPDLPKRAYTVMLVFGSAFVVILLLAGSPFIALLFAALTMWVWYARAHRQENGRGRP